MQSSRYTPLPALSRYLIRQFLAVFVPVMIAFVMLYVIVDLFERFDILLRHHATTGAAARYFLFKIPLMISQITPPAVITAVLISLGLLSRHNEVTALRATGVSLTQTAAPLVIVALIISCAILVWSETVVPYCSRRFQYVNNIEIRKRELRGILSDREIWYHGRSGFYNIDHVDKEKQVIYGLVIFAVDDEFHLNQVLEIPRAEWLNGQWHTTGALVREVGHSEISVHPLASAELEIPETLSDFLEVQREPEELSFLQLRAWIADLTRKGIDASHLLVELHLKLALPFASAVLALVGIPISGRLQRHPSMAGIVGVGMAVGFGYWVVLAFSNSLGHSGTLPAVIAAWSANLIYALLGTSLFLYSE